MRPLTTFLVPWKGFLMKQCAQWLFHNFQNNRTKVIEFELKVTFFIVQIN